MCDGIFEGKTCMQVPVQGKDRDPDGILNKLYVVHQLVAVLEKYSDNFKDVLEKYSDNFKDGFSLI